MTERDLEADIALIDRIGVAQLAALLGYTYQRVNNWKYRGIPFKERAMRPEVFKQQKTPTA